MCFQTIELSRNVAELRQDDDGTKRELKDFIDLIGPFFVISLRERKPSRTLVPLGSDKEEVLKWDRVGQEYVAVMENSAVLNLPSRFEIRIPIESDHSNMAKFDHKNQAYQVLLSYLKEVQQINSPTTYPWTKLLVPWTSRLAPQEEEEIADIESQEGLVDVAIKLIGSYKISHPLLLSKRDDIEIALLEARTYFSLLQSSNHQAPTEARAIVMDFCETLNDLIVLIDPGSHFRQGAASGEPGSSVLQILLRLEHYHKLLLAIYSVLKWKTG